MNVRRLVLSMAALGVTTAAFACGFTGVGTGSDDASPGAGSDASVPDVALADGERGDSDLLLPDAEGNGDASAAADADASSTVDAAVDPDASLDAGPPTAVGVTAVSALTLNVDLAKPADGAIGTDGQKDGVFDVDVTGPAIALVLIRTDAAGKPSGGQQWDTWVGADAIPGDLGASFSVGSSTYQVAVYEGLTLLNDANGRLTLSAGAHSLRLAGSNAGSFSAGKYFRVVLQGPDGKLVRGPVVGY